MLKERILPIAKEMQGATWAQIIDKCYGLGVDLSAKYMYVIGLLDFLKRTLICHLFIYLPSRQMQGHHNSVRQLL